MTIVFVSLESAAPDTLPRPPHLEFRTPSIIWTRTINVKPGARTLPTRQAPLRTINPLLISEILRTSRSSTKVMLDAEVGLVRTASGQRTAACFAAGNRLRNAALNGSESTWNPASLGWISSFQKPLPVVAVPVRSTKLKSPA